jgi:quercetin 2,3-dioxygenase
VTFEHVADPSGKPSWQGVLPGTPDAYFLPRGDGERAMLGGDLFTVLVSGDETGNQFGMFTASGPAGDIIPTHSHAAVHETFYIAEGKVRVYVQTRDGRKLSRLLLPGDFGYVPAGAPHTYHIEEAALIVGACTGGFERFFQQAGAPTDSTEPGQPFFDFGRWMGAMQAHANVPLNDFDWSDADDG